MNIFFKSAISFFILLFFTRILGKKQMSQITYFNYITGITLGSIAASVCVDETISLYNGLISIITWSLLTFFISLLSLKSHAARNLFDGEPDIIIKHGELLQDTIKKNLLNIDDITMLLRERNIFSIQDVEYAILEPHGKLSILKKPHLNSATKKDLNIPTNPSEYLPTDIIIDGKIIEKNLVEINKDKKWLEKELKKYNLSISQINQIFYLCLEKDGSIYLCLKNSPLSSISS